MRTRRRALAACAVLALLVAACGDDDDSAEATGDPVDETTETSADEGAEDEEPAAPSELTITVTDDGVELSADEIAGGPVELTLDNQTSGFTEADLTLVDPGTSPEQFAEGFAPVIAGGPFPDFVRNNAGLGADGGGSSTSTVLLEAGDYIAWALPEGPEEGGEASEGEAPEGEGLEEGAAEAPLAEEPGEGEAPEGGEGGEGEAPPPEAFLTATLTVTEPAGDVEFPETENTITASDYAFDVDVTGPGPYTYANDGPVQYHHAVVVGFGTQPVDVVEENFPAFLEAEGPEDAPEALDVEQVNFDLGFDSGPFGPTGQGTFEADFVEGETYAVVCFISDKAGGPPHAIAYDMWEVFQVGA